MIDGLARTHDSAPAAPSAEELSVAERALSVALAANLLYARVELLLDGAGRPCLLELELTEPSLLFNHVPGAAERFAREILLLWLYRLSAAQRALAHPAP